MKKFMSIILIFIICFSAGCSNKEKENEKGGDNKVQVMKKIDPKAAKSFMENYMGYVLKRDTGAMKSFYSSALKEKIRDIPSEQGPHPVGYKLEEGENKEKDVEFKVHIYNATTGSPYYSDDSLKYTVTMENGKMQINKIEKDKTTIEVFAKGKTLYKKEGDKVIGDYVISLTDLPDYGIPRYTSSPEQKFPIPKQAFGPTAISPDGKSIVITSMEKHSFLALVKGGEEDKQTANLQEEGGGQGGKKGSSDKEQGGEQGGEQKKEESPQEKEMERVKKQTVKPIDFFLNTKVNAISFSPDGKMFVAELIPQGRLSGILIYREDGGEVVETEIEKQFRPDRFAVSAPYFTSEDKLVFTITPPKDATREEQAQGGTWSYDTKEKKISKIQ